ncbi:tetratricopeptide repeat-containing sensor histidine kinase [Flavobacterium sedimenticola]|uniref:histidine kinase n=1 Tax=Flavobacterium sedimenticola TaxID=3043286 RepID=A0ABT6XPJ2_9FLAO|nr:tetratricopeptide repeat-containing sensor histidine kinase [Flavobacterium sedimenticola]MDI9256981.1 tetratricopeptide repeat-containing sensor histidine kinase [Flavobacterium sedimenticola]
MPRIIRYTFIVLMCLFCLKNSAQATSFTKDSVSYYLKESKKHTYTDFNKAKFYLVKADKIARQLNDQNAIADVIFQFAANYYIVGSYDIALKNYIKASEIYDAQNNKLGVAKCLMGQGLIQQVFGRDQEALKNFKKSIAICRTLNNNPFTVKNLLNIGVSEANLNQYEEAYHHFSESLKLSRKFKLADDSQMAMNKLGYIHFAQNNLDSSVYYYQKVLNNNVKPNLWEEAYALSGLSEVYLKKEDYATAESYGLKGFTTAKIVGAKWDIARSSEILTQIYEKKNDFKSAYHYLVITKAYNDSLYAESKIKEVNILQLKAKEAENDELMAKAETAQQKLYYTRIFVGFIIILLLSLSVFTYQYHKYTKQKGTFFREIEIKNQEIQNQQSMILSQNLVLEELNQTKNKIFSILSHDLKTPINSLIQVIELNKQHDLTKEEQAFVFEQLQKQVEGTSLILNHLLKWANSQIDGTNVHFEKIALNQIVEESVNSFHAEVTKKKVTFNHHNTESIFIKADIGQVRIIVQNIIANAVKFAPLHSRIDIFYSSDEKYQKIHIKDYGNGLNQNKIEEIMSFNKRLPSEKGTSMEEGTGLGLLLVKQFLINNQGQLEIRSEEEKMTEFIISFLKY